MTGLVEFTKFKSPRGWFNHQPHFALFNQSKYLDINKPIKCIMKDVRLCAWVLFKEFAFDSDRQSHGPNVIAINDVLVGV